jgi:hypothetical protein
MAILRSFRLPPWAPWLLVVAALPFGLIGWMAAKAAANRARAWPIAQGVVAQLQDPAQAKGLWERNPALHDSYPDPESFQAELSTWLPRFNALPAQEPVESQGAYGLATSPMQLRLAVKGQGGAWMYLVVEGSNPFDAQEMRGEGITRLHFAEDRAGLTGRQRLLISRRNEALWARFRGVESQLREEGLARRLWAAEPRLHRAYKAQEDLLRSTAPWRHPRPALPPDIASVAGDLSLQFNDSPFGHSETVGYPGPEGLMLWVTWTDGCLAGIDPTFEAHGH